MLTIAQIQEAVSDAAKRYNDGVDQDKFIASIELFGSYAEGRATETSDIDLIVEFAQPMVSLFTLASVLDVMEQATGKPVDLVQRPFPDDMLLEIDTTVKLYAAA